MIGTEIDNIMEQDTCMQIYGTKKRVENRLLHQYR